MIFTEKKIKSSVERKLKTLDKKYKKLINKSRPPLNDLSEEDIKLHKENTVKNLSTVEIPERFIDVLSKGIDYKIDYDIIARVEDATKTLPTINTSNVFCYDCCNILKKPRNKSKTNISEKTCRDITKWLNKNDLCLLEADNGRATSIISKNQVHEMVEQELNKPERYKKPRTDTIKKSRTSRNKKLAELKLKDLITKQEHSSLKPSVPKTPKARSILKIHKDRLKIRLIVNTQNSPIYKIAKKISKELTPLIRSGKSYIKDTEQFVDKIRNIKLEENGTMISFDISDMYPSLPKQDVITEVIRRINDENFKPSMNKKALTELVNISVEFMSSSCNNQYYEQKDGLFIGSSTSPALAELYIQRVEEIHVYKMIHTPRLWLRKVDDTFVITKYDKIETLDELNKFNCKVQFTYESATDNTLLFLDCLIEIDNEESLQTKLYRKKTHTGQYMHYTSNQPEHVKVGTIKTLVRRTKIVCSTEESLTEELNYIKKNNAVK